MGEGVHDLLGDPLSFVIAIEKKMTERDTAQGVWPCRIKWAQRHLLRKTVKSLAIGMVAGALQTSGGFESDDRGFENWMAASSAGVEREIAAEKAKPNAPAKPMLLSEEKLKANIRREIDRLFSDAFPMTS